MQTVDRYLLCETDMMRRQALRRHRGERDTNPSVDIDNTRTFILNPVFLSVNLEGVDMLLTEEEGDTPDAAARFQIQRD